MFIKCSLSSVVCQFFTSNKGYGDRHCFLKDWISVLINSVKNYFIFSYALLKNQYIVLWLTVKEFHKYGEEKSLAYRKTNY